MRRLLLAEQDGVQSAVAGMEAFSFGLGKGAELVRDLLCRVGIILVQVRDHGTQLFLQIVTEQPQILVNPFQRLIMKDLPVQLSPERFLRPFCAQHRRHPVDHRCGEERDIGECESKFGQPVSG